MLKQALRDISDATLPIRLGAGGLTRLQREMLIAANQCSLPGDGLRIVGPGKHRVASHLEALGFVRVARPSDGQKARVHVTENGRIVTRWLAPEKDPRE